MELRNRLTNFEESRSQRDDVEEDQHVAMSAKNASHPIGLHLSFESHPSKTFPKPSSSKSIDCVLYVTNVVILHLVFTKKTTLYVGQHQQKSPHKGFASSLSVESSFEVSKTDLVVDSVSTDHMTIDKTLFKIVKNLKPQLTIQIEGKQKLKE